MSLLNSHTQFFFNALSRAIAFPARSGRCFRPLPPRRSNGAAETRILHRAREFTFQDADQVSQFSVHNNDARRIVLDLTFAEDASTPALARLVELRAELLRLGRDLVLRNVRARVASRYELHRLHEVLPLT